jgi:predicted O-methyltransferase YrrM
MHIDKLVFRFFSYLSYFWKAQSNLYIHSPFIFDWVNAIQKERVTNSDSIQNYRNTLLHDKSTFIYTSFEQINYTTVSARYLKTSITDLYGKVLMATSSYTKANNFLELGTSLGVSTAYICASNNQIKGMTIDANPMAVDKSKVLFNQYFPNHTVNFVTGSFDVTLPSALCEFDSIDLVFIDGDHSYKGTLEYVTQIKDCLSEKAVIILDDIRWSKDMYKAWSELLSLPEFNYTVDMGRIGLLFKVNNHSPKQHFYIH